jgi:NADPH:quinone reductase-like Zn-dependent oxidoreductase
VQAMKAVVCDRYGPPDVLRITEVPRPVPGPGEVLIRIRATTAVCAGKNLELMRSLGADHVIDYTRDDFTAGGRSYDVIFDAVGKHSFRRSKDALNPGGIYLATDHLQNLALAATTRFADKKVVFPIPPRYTRQDVVFLKGLMEAGKYRAVIDRRYPLEDVVVATRYVETEQKTGNVVLTVS